jgi:hypothetical protein
MFQIISLGGKTMTISMARWISVFIICALASNLGAFAQIDVCGYPDNSNSPRSLVRFKSNECVASIAPQPGSFVALGAGESIRLWYSGPHAITLGLRKIILKQGKSTTTIDCDVSPMILNPWNASPPRTGCEPSGDELSGVDREGRPISPVLFVTEITTDPSSRVGDWQQGGVGVLPHAVFGTWKAGVKRIELGEKNTSTHFSSDPDPAKNGWNLGDGSDQPPAGTRSRGFGTECIWHVDDLGLQPGSTYRLQFIVHGGDLEKSGSDAGEVYTSITVASPPNCNVSPQNPFVTEGESVTFTATPSGGIPPFSYLWSTGEVSQSITVHLPGTYTVEIRDRIGQPTICQSSLNFTPGITLAYENSLEFARYAPIAYKLEQNYPNPFNPETTIPFNLPEESIVHITVLNILGQRVTTLLDERVQAGYRSVIWNPQNDHLMRVSSGFYFCRMQARSLLSNKDYSEIRKMLYLQ